MSCGEVRKIRNRFLFLVQTVFYLKNERTKALFACLMSRTISTNEQCFSLTTNQRTVLSTMAFQKKRTGSKFRHGKPKQ